MRRLVFLLVAATVGLALTVGAGAATTKLVGTDGPGFTITLTKGGKKLTKLKAGKVSIQINDKATDHNFRLTGPGVNKATTVPFVGKKTWNLTLKKGTYRFVCDPHASSMKGSFKVS